MIKLVDCEEVSNSLDVEPEIILAIARVESSQDINGFLFEPHQFSRLTEHKFDKRYPTISYSKWDPSRYPKTKAEKQRQFDTAAKLDIDKTYEATSWGLFQIMGYHYHVCLYGSAISMATDLRAGIDQNMKAFGLMIKHMNLITALKNKEWEYFAKIYNGPSFRVLNYDLKIKTEYDSIIARTHAGFANT